MFFAAIFLKQFPLPLLHLLVGFCRRCKSSLLLPLFLRLDSQRRFYHKGSIYDRRYSLLRPSSPFLPLSSHRVTIEFPPAFSNNPFSIGSISAGSPCAQSYTSPLGRVFTFSSAFGETATPLSVAAILPLSPEFWQTRSRSQTVIAYVGLTFSRAPSPGLPHLIWWMWLRRMSHRHDSWGNPCRSCVYTFTSLSWSRARGRKIHIHVNDRPARAIEEVGTEGAQRSHVCSFFFIPFSWRAAVRFKMTPPDPSIKE